MGGVGSAVGVVFVSGGLLFWSSPLTMVSTWPTRKKLRSVSLLSVASASTVVLNLAAIVERLSPGCTVYCTGLPGCAPWPDVTGCGVVVACVLGGGCG